VNNSVHRRRRQPPGPTVQFGKPLPEFGTCMHYKRSCRWLRFPCCGKAYPCDVCHDEDQDHVMELASRMLCGYCAKEQGIDEITVRIVCAVVVSLVKDGCECSGSRSDEVDWIDTWNGQPYNNGKPCVACGAMMTKGSYSSHWEGGQGCRNRIKMSQ
ncbi:hypothetical protein scyTo_0015681, partial [Scyliorhinus torazame]|nr:hypothetical protein [Scyliorhinus torazame]